MSLRGDEPYDELDILKNIDATMILHELPFTEEKVGRVHAARRYHLLFYSVNSWLMSLSFI